MTELKPNLNWSPKDDPDYHPENENSKSETLVLVVMALLNWSYIIAGGVALIVALASYLLH